MLAVKNKGNTVGFVMSKKAVFKPKKKVDIGKKERK